MINQCLRTCNELQNLNTAAGKTEEEVHLETEEEGMAGTRVGEVLPVRKEGDPWSADAENVAAVLAANNHTEEDPWVVPHTGQAAGVALSLNPLLALHHSNLVSWPPPYAEDPWKDRTVGLLTE
jgi:hypothetical protein